jgi:hypothetical protein
MPFALAFLLLDLCLAAAGPMRSLQSTAAAQEERAGAAARGEEGVELLGVLARAGAGPGVGLEAMVAARRLGERVPPEELEGELERHPRPVADALATLGRILDGADAEAGAKIGAYLAAWARERGRRMGRRGRWSGEEIKGLVGLQLVDARRFAAEAGFRGRVLGMMASELDRGAPAGLRDEVLLELNAAEGFDFAASEAVEGAWGAVPRRAAERREDYGGEGLRFEADGDGRLVASVYSFPSSFFGDREVAALLAEVRRLSPERTLIALTDLPLSRRLAEAARVLRIHLLETYGRAYSPWPRDPFSLVRSARGGVVVLARPNAQRGREEDLHLGAELVRGLPADLDRAWGGARWTEAPVPFHNGQVLLGREAAWVSLHSLEPRILALLGLARVPVESFDGSAGIGRYVEAARRAAAELTRLYGRPVRFVHPLPPLAPLAPLAPIPPPSRPTAAGQGAAPPATPENERGEDAELMRRIGGGAGYDLDSILTLLPAGRDGAPAALVAGIEEGRALLSALPAGELDGLRRGYDLEPAGETLAAALAAAQRHPRIDALAGFLDLVAAHLAHQGFRVSRLPLLAVPLALVRDHGEGVPVAPERVFLLTWNNVVLDRGPAGLRAEGFSAQLPSGDAAARRAFAAAGCRLDLLPPLVRSIVANGGYRCASNHVRSWR